MAGQNNVANGCMVCIKQDGRVLQEMANAGGVDQRPDRFPESIWRDRSWFLICLTCFVNLITYGPPKNSEEIRDEEEEENQNTFAWANLDFTPLTDEQENLFWGDFRQQRLDDYIEELAVMLSENAQNGVDLDALTDSFWSDPDFWSDLQTQWSDEIDEMISLASSD